MMKKLFALASLLLAVGIFMPAISFAVPATLMDDTYALSVKPKTNFGSVATIHVGGGGTGFIQFDLSTLPNGALPEDIAKATLTLYVTGGTIKAPGTFSVKRVTSSWNELTLTGASMPSIGSADATGVAGSASEGGQFITVGITSLAKNWVTGAGGNNGPARSLHGTRRVQLHSKR